MKEYVYYVSYGSNLLEARLMLYIEGGENKELGIKQVGCTDSSSPLETIIFKIPFALYFAQRSAKWQNKGVAFLDITKKGTTFGKGYLITKEQYLQIKEQEGSWYDKEVYLGEIKGYPLFTFTSSKKYAQIKPGDKYLNVIREGILKTYTDITKEEVNKYFERSFL